MSLHSIRAAASARALPDGQVKGTTIASQLEALAQQVQGDGLDLEPELRFVDDGYSGSTLVRRDSRSASTGGRGAR